MFFENNVEQERNPLIQEMMAFFELEEDPSHHQGFVQDPYERIGSFFFRIHLIFEEGDYDQALECYRCLFDYLLDPEGGAEFPFYHFLEDKAKVDLLMARKEYLLSTYLVSSPEDRAVEFLHNISFILIFDRAGFTFLELQEFYGEPLPEFKEFLEEILERMKEDVYPEAAPDFLLEAASILHGREGIISLAREMKEELPEAYIEWIEILKEEEDYHKVVEVAEEALESIHYEPYSTKIAKELAYAAEEIGDGKLMIEALSSALFFEPNLENLILLLDTGARHISSEEIYQRAEELLARCKEEQGSFSRDSYRLLFLYLNLWSGKFKEAIDSISSIPSMDLHLHLLSSFLCLFAEEEIPSNLEKIMENARDKKYNALSLKEPIYQAYSARVQSLFLEVSPQERHAYYLWCKEEIRERVEGIVSTNTRESYNLAATLLAAFYEALRGSSYAEEVYDLCKGIKHSFPRHRSFQRELEETGLFR